MDQPDAVIEIRWMIVRDFPEVANIDWLSFGPCDEYWDPKCLKTVVEDHYIVGMVAEFNQRLAGFVIYELKKKSMEVLRLAVAPCLRRKGVGTALLDYLIDRMRISERKRIMIDVGDGNLSAHMFLKAREFSVETIWNGYYDDGSDAYQFVRRK